MAPDIRQLKQKERSVLAGLSAVLLCCLSSSQSWSQDRGSPMMQPGELPAPPPSARQGGVPKETYDLVNKSKEATDAGRCEEARRLLTEALKLSPDYADIYDALGYSYLKEDKFRDAETALIKGLNIDPLNVGILENLGNANYHQEKFDQAIVFYKQALSLIKNNDAQAADTYVNLASALAEKGDVNQAQQYFTKAIQLKSDFPKAYNALARMFYNTGKYQLAASNAKKAIYFKPDYAMAFYHLGLSELAMHHRPEATEALQNSLKFETNRSYADDTKRLLAKITNGEDGSGIVVPSAASSAPNAADAEKVSTLIDQKRWVQAEELLREMISRGNGENPILYNNLGFALAHERTSTNSMDSYKKAIEAYKKAITLQKGPFPSANYNMGQAYRLLGDNRMAEATFRHAIIEAQSMRMSMPLAHNALGMVLKQRGAFEAADKEYRKALSQAGEELPVVHYNLGILLEHMGKNKQAAVEYGLYLSLAPNGLNAKQAKFRLSRLSQG